MAAPSTSQQQLLKEDSDSCSRPSPLVSQLRLGAVTVLQGTASFGALGGMLGSALGVVRNQPAIPLAFTSALNTSIFTFSFLSIREYLVHPFLLPPQPTFADAPHTYHLLSSAVAGLPVGGLFSFFARGPKGVVRAAATLSLGCTAVQCALNELELLRIQTLAWSEERSSLPTPTFPAVEHKPIPTFTRPTTSATPIVPSRETFSERSDRLIGTAWRATTGWVGSWSPVRKLDKGDYQRVLMSRLGVVEGELEDVRRERITLERERRE